MMERIKRLEGNILCFPMTPSRWVSSDRHDYLEIAMTAGGGMGGSFWYEYIEPCDLPTNQIITVTDINGTEKYINTSYITVAQKVDVLTARYVSKNQLFKQSGRNDIVRKVVPESGRVVTMQGNMF